MGAMLSGTMTLALDRAGLGHEVRNYNRSIVWVELSTSTVLSGAAEERLDCYKRDR